MTLPAPTLLTAQHALEFFDCGVVSLNEWLKRRAHPNQINGASRTYVVVDHQKVIAYYCLASGGLALNDAPSSVRRNMPDPVPMAILGRLAVDQQWHGKGLGSALLSDAVERTIQAASILGIRGLLVHTLNDKAKTFYEHYGFKSSPTQPMTLVMSIKNVVT